MPRRDYTAKDYALARRLMVDEMDIGQFASRTHTIGWTRLRRANRLRYLASAVEMLT